MSEQIVEKVRQAVSDVFGLPVEDVTEETSSDDVETWDSHNMINLLMVLESEFGVKLKASDAKDMLSVKLIVEVLRERGVS
jgi:acyl carrier protein